MPCASAWRPILANPIANPPRIAVVGVSGYAGAELARILLRHPHLLGSAPTCLGRMGEVDTDSKPVRLTDMHPQLAGLPGADSLVISSWTWKDLEREGINFLFLATPHEQSRTLVPEALARGIRVVDLSGAWRLHEAENRAVYRFEAPADKIAAETQAQAVYGSP